MAKLDTEVRKALGLIAIPAQAQPAAATAQVRPRALGYNYANGCSRGREGADSGKTLG